MSANTTDGIVAYQQSHETDKGYHADDILTEKVPAEHLEAEDSVALPTKPTEYADAQMKSALDRVPLWQAARRFWRVALICSLAGFTASTDGYQNQVSGSILANKGFIHQFANGAKKLNPSWVSAFNGIFSAGQVVGQFSVPFLSELVGRRGAVFCIMALLVVVTVVEIVSKVWWHWMLSKLLCGMGIGAVQATLAPFINELAPAQIRGFLVVSYSLWWSLGGLLGSIVLKVRSDSHPLDYKTTIYTQFAMIGLSTAIFIFLPESPWWCARKGKIDRARKILDSNYRGVEGYDSERELGIILATIEQQRQWDREAQAEGRFALLKGLNLKRFLIGSYPKVLQQFVGLAVFSSNAAYFFQIASPSFDPFLVTVILGVVGLLAVIFDALLVDRMGRRFMTLVGFTGACTGITLIAIVGCTNYQHRPPVASLLIFGGCVASFFNTFQSSTSYAYLTEMPEQRFKARATGWGLAWCNLWAVMINFTLPLMLKVWSVRAAFFFVCTGVPGTVLAFFIMPESSQRSPAEIHELFTERINLRKWRGHKTAVEYDLETRLAMAGV